MRFQRKKAPEVGVKPLWKKITRGTLYPFANRRNVKVTQNGTLEATEDEIEKFKEHFQLLREGTGPYKSAKIAPERKPEPVKNPETPAEEKVKPFKSKNKKGKDLKETAHPVLDEEDAEEYEIVPAGEGLFNVVSSVGKVLNSEPLPKEEAKELKKGLDAVTKEEE